MYPETILEWLIGLAIILFAMILLGLFSYFLGHWLEKKHQMRDEEDEE